MFWGIQLNLAQHGTKDYQPINFIFPLFKHFILLKRKTMCLTFLVSPDFVSMPNYLPHLCQSALLIMCSPCAHNNSTYKLMILIAYHILETAVPNTLQNRLTIPYSLTLIYILFLFQLSLSLVFVLRVGN